MGDIDDGWDGCCSYCGARWRSPFVGESGEIWFHCLNCDRSSAARDQAPTMTEIAARARRERVRALLEMRGEASSYGPHRIELAVA